MATTDMEGRFEIRDILQGAYVVMVSGEGISKKYSTSGQTPLRFTVKTGDNVATFALEE